MIRFAIGLGCLVWAAMTGVPSSSAVAEETSGDASSRKFVLMIAGGPSHGYGAHEHYAGMKILESSVAGPDCEVQVVRGWPEDASLVDRADALVFYSDGGTHHPALPHLDVIEAKVAEGCGVAAIHYSVETVLGDQGDRWLELMGGHFEIHYSVNPHWTAPITSLPEHPITRHVDPFAINDEWYFHLRLLDSGVTPILQAVAPPETMRRPDGHHSGNPSARKSVAAGEIQTLAWAFERSDHDPAAKGRSFGITGGHNHWVWANGSMRNLTANGIRWTAGLEPRDDDRRVVMEELLANQDYPQPKDFDAGRVAPYLDSAAGN